MAHRFEEDAIRKAWAALSTQEFSGAGWQSIALSSENSRFFRAGIQFPEKNESFLVRFDLTTLPKGITLPQGEGFSVVNLGSLPGSSGLWIALSRQPFGDIEMFGRMATDVLDTCAKFSTGNGEQAINIFLQRILSWQNFMKKTRSPLNAQEQLGLCGELELLGELLAAGVAPISAISYWKGPAGETHDFVFPSGALEVKSTKTNSKVRISSAEQLDSLLTAPLFLAVFHFVNDNEVGQSLAERIRAMEARLADNPHAQHMFQSCLLDLGILEIDGSWDSDRLLLQDKHFFSVISNFPTISASCLPEAISDVRYSIDSSKLSDFTTTLPTILHDSGVV